MKAFITGDPLDAERKGVDAQEFTPMGIASWLEVASSDKTQNPWTENVVDGNGTVESEEKIKNKIFNLFIIRI